MRSVGIDLAKRKSVVSIIDGGKKVTQRRTVRELEQLVDWFGPNCEPARIAIEAGRGSWFAYDLLRSWGNQVWMLDTTRIKELGVGRHGRKTDRIDADAIALAVAENRIKVAHVLSQPSREIREELVVRRQLIRMRKELVVQIRGLLFARGVKAPSCGGRDFAQLLDGAQLDPDVAAIVEPLAQLLAPVEAQLAVVDEKLHLHAQQQPVMRNLATVPGVALIGALSFVCVVDDPSRFRYASQVASYFGLVPLERSSGGKQHLGGITKHGNSYARATLVQAAWSMLRSTDMNDPLVQWAHRTAERRGKNVAVVAVARRLARILWSLWKNDDVYDPVKLAHQSARGHEREARDDKRFAKTLRAGAAKLHKQRKESARRGLRARELEERGGPVMAL